MALTVVPSVSLPSATPRASAATTCPDPATSVLFRPRGTTPKVALTFDDGPGPYTGQVLNILGQYHVHATFFVTGQHVKAHPRKSRRIVREGNYLGNHSWSHPQAIAGSVPYGDFDQLTELQQKRQMNRTNRVVRDITGQRPCFFRAPGLAHFSPLTQRLAYERRMSIVDRSNDTYDWQQPGYFDQLSVDTIFANATNPLFLKTTVLAHDSKASPEPEDVVSSYRGNTVAALPGIIQFYKSRGYAFTDPRGRAFR